MERNGHLNPDDKVDAPDALGDDGTVELTCSQIVEIAAMKAKNKACNQDNATGFTRFIALRSASGIAAKVQRKIK
jgi:hypothetical protein